MSPVTSYPPLPPPDQAYERMERRLNPRRQPLPAASVYDTFAETAAQPL